MRYMWGWPVLLGFGFIATAGAGYLPDAAAAVWYVDRNNASGVQNGASWATAYATVQPAIDAAFYDGGGDVWVAAGVYSEIRESYPHGGMLDPAWNTASLLLRDGVRLYGGFSGNETSQDERDWQANVTVLDGAFSREGGPALHVVVGAPNAALDGFIVRGGNASGVNERGRGGGLHIPPGSSMEVANCRFLNNNANGGGALAVMDAAPYIANCSFEINNGLSGGAMYHLTSDAVVDNCLFSSNEGGHGGAMYNIGDSAPTVINSTFEENRGTTGGAVYNFTVSPVLINCLFNRNRGPGGAIHNQGASPVITGCTFIRNITSGPGGAITNAGGSPEITNSIFVGNRGRGGALNNQFSSSPIVRNCTFTQNVGSSDTAGIYSEGAAHPVITNSILWNNGSIEILNADEALVTITHSNIQGGYPGEGNLDTDPRFRNADDADVRLRADSPCIDAGNLADAPAEDIDGQPRPYGAGADLGAHEYAGPRMTLGPLSVTETETGPVEFDVVYKLAETVVLSADHIGLTGDSGVHADAAEVAPLGNGAYRITLNGFTGRGAVRIEMLEGSAYDAAGNPAAPAGPTDLLQVDGPPGEPGDVNRDGVVNAVDVQLVINAALGIETPGADADVNCDGAVNALDVQAVINAALNIPIGPFPACG